ncbi:hypothetical protein Pmani_028807 [Petrolisthes manimaculis]|uniref:Uncharacterized protein n=1 Tax=Petrolisthes manimaculis TaxID=1843537 RepID=A0AAE1P1C7_9EUCA|nr:hypothetical protein Pmani_028807 [Petrolisthes manimaculis]
MSVRCTGTPARVATRVLSPSTEKNGKVSGWDGPWVELPSVSRCTLAFTLMIPSPSTSLSPAVPDSLQ